MVAALALAGAGAITLPIYLGRRGTVPWPDLPAGSAAAQGAGRAGSPGSLGSPDELRVSTAEWRKTDFSKHTVPLGEIMSGGPGKDGIPPIDVPKFVDTVAASRWLNHFWFAAAVFRPEIELRLG